MYAFNPPNVTVRVFQNDIVVLSSRTRSTNNVGSLAVTVVVLNNAGYYILERQLPL